MEKYIKNCSQEIHVTCGQRNWTCVPSTGCIFVVGLSMANLSHRKTKPAEHFVTATAFRDMTKLTALIRKQWR